MISKEVVTTFPRAVLPALTSEVRGFAPSWIGDGRTDSFGINRHISHKAISLYARETTLYETASRLEDLLVTWLLVADERQAHIYECHKPAQKLPWGEDSRYNREPVCQWEMVPDGTINALSIDDYRGGCSWSPGGTVSFGDELQRSLFDQHKAIKEELKRQFIRMIAEKLEQASEKYSFDRLMLVAPSAMIADLGEYLDVRTQNCIIGVLSKYPLRFL